MHHLFFQKEVDRFRTLHSSIHQTRWRNLIVRQDAKAPHIFFSSIYCYSVVQVDSVLILFWFFCTGFYRSFFKKRQKFYSQEQPVFLPPHMQSDRKICRKLAAWWSISSDVPTNVMSVPLIVESLFMTVQENKRFSLYS